MHIVGIIIMEDELREAIELYMSNISSVEGELAENPHSSELVEVRRLIELHPSSSAV